MGRDDPRFPLVLVVDGAGHDDLALLVRDESVLGVGDRIVGRTAGSRETSPNNLRRRRDFTQGSAAFVGNPNAGAIEEYTLRVSAFAKELLVRGIPRTEPLDDTVGSPVASPDGVTIEREQLRITAGPRDAECGAVARTKMGECASV